MLRINVQRVAANVRQYFVEALCRDDYYSHGTEEPGLWQGRAAEFLGLRGPVDGKSFRALTDNINPSTGEQLTARQKDTRRVGYDFTFSVPKSVSVVHALTGDDDIRDAFLRAVQETMAEVEAAMQTRVRRGGSNHDRVTGNMLWAQFVHYTARPVRGRPDMHLHAHCFAFNATHDGEEQRWKAGQFRSIISKAPDFQSRFFSRLAMNLVACGYELRRTEHAFEIAGVPEQLIREFSRRTEIIETIAEEMGFEDSAQKAGLGARTRERKRDDVSLEQLREEWSSRVDPDLLDKLRGLKSSQLTPGTDSLARESHEQPTNPELEDGIPDEEAPLRPGEQSAGVLERLADPIRFAAARRAVESAARTLFERDAVVDENQLKRLAISRAYGWVRPEDVDQATETLPGYIRHEAAGRTLLTTKELVDQEREMVEFARASRMAFRPLGSKPISLASSTLSESDKRVLSELMASRDGVTLLKMSGRSFRPEVVKAAITGIEQSAQNVVVVAATPNAGQQAKRELGINDCPTVSELLADRSDEAKLRPLLFRNVIWVEQAGRLGTRAMCELLALAARFKCRVVLSGDEKQHRATQHGDAFRVLRSEAALKTVERKVVEQRLGAVSQAMEDLVNHDGNLAADILAEAGLTHEHDDEPELIESAAKQYVASMKLGESAMVVGVRRKVIDQLTASIRQRLRELGRLGNRDKSVLQLRPTRLGEEDRRRAESYRRGMVIEFHKNTRGFRTGERTRVVFADPLGGVWVHHKLYMVRLKLSHAERFTVYEPRRGSLASGDRIRLTRNGRDVTGRRVRNGTTHTVVGFVPLSGDAILASGRVLSRRFGHFEHDYATTTHGVQGRQSDSVILAATSDDLQVMDRGHLYTAANAARKRLNVHHADLERLRAAARRDNDSLAATDLTDRREELRNRLKAEERMREQQRRENEQRMKHGL